MGSICGIDCSACQFHNNCRGCVATCGKPFGGECIAAEYIKVGGKAAYAAFKDTLITEINADFVSLGIPSRVEQLVELTGAYVNLAYPLPSGEAAKFLQDDKVYLGTQVESADAGACFGVIADTTFYMICSYGEGGSNPELLLYKKR